LAAAKAEAEALAQMRAKICREAEHTLLRLVEKFEADAELNGFLAFSAFNARGRNNYEAGHSVSVTVWLVTEVLEPTRIAPYRQELKAALKRREWTVPQLPRVTFELWNPPREATGANEASQLTAVDKFSSLDATLLGQKFEVRSYGRFEDVQQVVSDALSAYLNRVVSGAAYAELEAIAGKDYQSSGLALLTMPGWKSSLPVDESTEKKRDSLHEKTRLGDEAIRAWWVARRKSLGIGIENQPEPFHLWLWRRIWPPARRKHFYATFLAGD
jgi:hypothetical protein